MNEEFMEQLIELRKRYDRPMKLSSAYRAESHPAERAKSQPGYHNQGRAIDCLVNGTDAYDLVKLAIEMGFSVGIQQAGDRSKRFIHIDNRSGPKVIWSYK